MDALVEAIQDVVIAEPETETQHAPAQPDDGALETQLTNQISSLWTEHNRLSADRRTTAVELRQIRAILAERLHEMKSLLSRPGRGGEWWGWLREQGIPRSSADRLCARHSETLGIEKLDAPREAITNSADDSADKLAKSVWQRSGKFLSTDEAAFQFIDRIAELSGVGHERRAEGLLILNPAPKPPDELPVTAPIIDPAPQSSEEVSVMTLEPIQDTAAAPPELGLAVAAVGAGNGNVL